MELDQRAFRLASATSNGWRWSMQRNCSVTPVQLGGTLVLLSVVSLGVAGFFWWQGAVLVLPFAILEVLAVFTAFMVYARHAADGERIDLVGGRLVVEREVAGRTQRAEFVREWVQVAATPVKGLVEVRSGTQSVQVGRYLSADLRPLLARELKRALRSG